MLEKVFSLVFRSVPGVPVIVKLRLKDEKGKSFFRNTRNRPEHLFWLLYCVVRL